MEFLRADDQVHMREMVEQGGAARLRHASEKSKNDFRPALRHVAEHAHFPERLLLGHVAHAAGVEEHHVRLGLVRRAFVAACQQRMRDLFGVALIHLAAVGFDEEFRHGRAEIIHGRAIATVD